MAEEPIANQSVLAVMPLGEDRISLQDILHQSKWKLRFTATLEEARDALRVFSFGIVMSECHLPGGLCWKDLLHETQGLANSPPLIVVDRVAEEWLWAEVLNLGGHDLLMKPFDSREVLHAISVACHFCENEQRIRMPRKSVTSIPENIFERPSPIAWTRRASNHHE